MPHETYYERALPHWQVSGRDLFVTWRLKGSLSLSEIAKLKSSKTEGHGRRFREFDLELDKAGFGVDWLKDPRIAAAVVAGLEEIGQRGLWDLHAWVVMPNHVHVLFQPKTELRRIMQVVKGKTAREANLLLGRTGESFWQTDSYDRWVRDTTEFGKIKTYVERNPVMAGLVERVEDFRWSSAYKEKKEKAVFAETSVCE